MSGDKVASDKIEPERPVWAFDPATAMAQCTTFIHETLAATDHDGVVVGLSGGIDSAVSAALAVGALSAAQVHGVKMPYATSSPDSLADADAVAGYLGITTEQIDITPMVDAYPVNGDAVDPVRRGNVMARVRMTVLYDLSARDRRLVLGTGNRTENLLGYTTLYGDNASALNPIGQLYKTEIRLLAAHLGLPEVLLTKAPSADLWVGQADEDELGFTYAEADQLLHLLIDQRLERRQIEALGFSRHLVDTIAAKVVAMAFKRLPTPVARFPGRLDPDT